MTVTISETFSPSLERATLIRRYKRFLADVALADGARVTILCPNPGRMTGLAEPDQIIWIQPKTQGKHRYTWQISETDRGCVGINTGVPNGLVRRALEARAIALFSPYTAVAAEVTVEDSRIDFCLSGANTRPCWIEVKNVTMSRPRGVAEFPDAVTARGAKHLRRLSQLARAGDRAVNLYLVQRRDCDRFSIAADIDPDYAAAHADAARAGVEYLALACQVTPDAVTLDPTVVLDLV